MITKGSSFKLHMKPYYKLKIIMMLIEEKKKQLEAVENDMCITVTIPTIKSGNYEKNRIRWKNAISGLRDNIQDNNLDHSVLETIDDLSTNNEFWAHQEHGLVGYFSNNTKEFIKLKHETVELCDVSESFNIYPLISEIQAQSSLYVLCVSKNKTCLYLVSRGIVEEIDISGCVVKDYDEAMNFDDSTGSLQHHTTQSGNAKFHGTSAQEDIEGVRTKQYLRRVDDGLMEIIQGQKIPLMLACVDEYLPIYKEVTSYNHMIDQNISGNPDNLSKQDILESTDCILTSFLGDKVAKFLKKIDGSLDSNMAFNNIDIFREAITMNNIDALLVNESNLAQLDKSEINKLTRDIVQAHNLGAKIICVNDEESDDVILGIHRFNRTTAS